MQLSTVQKQLLCDLVEAEQRIPEGKRTHFIIARTVGPPGVQLIHSGWLQKDRRVFEGNLESLSRADLISISNVASGYQGFYVTELGFSAYEQLAMLKGEPIKRIESIPIEYLKASEFQRRYPAAYSKWSQAESMLWSSHSDESLTTIGHLTREALQEFATTLANRLATPNLEPDTAKTVSRIRASLAVLSAKLGATEKPFLEALLAYWGTVSDLVQRQEHGGQRDGELLKWRDGRRVVLQVALLMFEIDEAVMLAE